MATQTATTNATAAPVLRKGVVKFIVSGDTIIIRGQPKSGPPPEKQVTLSFVTAPKLAKNRAGGEETKDEPWAWEAREFLREKLIGKDVTFTCEKIANSAREYGNVFLGEENITESIVKAGLVSVRRDVPKTAPEYLRLQELEEEAKAANRGMYSNSPASDHVRNIKWTQENHSQIVESFNKKPIKAIIEHVKDGSTIRAFLILPDSTYYFITLMISGIRSPGPKYDASGKPEAVEYFEEARYFVESRLLHRDVEIILESNTNTNFVGSILFPKGNIAEALLREGLAKCFDRSMQFSNSGADKLRSAEKQAKDKRLRLWTNYQSNNQIQHEKDKDFQGTVIEVFYGDAISVKSAAGQVKKVYLSSIRPPREQGKPVEDGEVKKTQRNKNFRPLYDIPWMFEAREFLRKKLIGKKVNCTLDYISPARDNFPEKYCYTVTLGGQNIAETMVSKGLATVVKYRADDDQRSSKYDDLKAAEDKAQKAQCGLHAKKDIPIHRINDLTADHSRIKHQYLPSWQRALRTEASVEFIASGSRIRLYIPKDSCLVTFCLAGISCRRSSRPAMNGVPAQEGEPYGDKALEFTKDKILQRDVSVHIDTTDKASTCVIGWLWIDQLNLSVALVEEGLAEVHFSAEKSEHYRALKQAEDRAKAAKKNIWADYVEVTEEKNKEEPEDTVVERKIDRESVIITEVTPEIHFYAQNTRDGSKLENLMSKLRQEFQTNPPMSGTFTPKRNDICAAKFSDDNEWYRAKIEKLQSGQALIRYIDYGNKENVPLARLASLPSTLNNDKPYATEYALALVALPPEAEDKEEAYRVFAQDVLNQKLMLNVEFISSGVSYATLENAQKVDIGKELIKDGYLMVDKRRERKIQDLLSEYKEAETVAKKAHKGIWEYGDITQDDPVDL
ncbi:staphylococcal nuclease domain-containing protein 1 [Condylostylus longicornis]|uniref:staphylococcal nuclease domain-containing protein 1 n=1 Tax=Condylostylus longicornis TaxID=2530218 RepID=UPI00244DE1A8|nr:staphylococcal nuclease domain-containing protein 1 [Condylostylus longicornis]